MKINCSFLLFFCLLLTGCFSGKEYPSGLLNNESLQETVWEYRMLELNQNPVLRLGVPASAEKTDFSELQKKCKANERDLQIIPCDEKYLKAFLINGNFDLVYMPEVSPENAMNWGFFSLSGNLFIKNLLLYRTLCNPL